MDWYAIAISLFFKAFYSPDMFEKLKKCKLYRVGYFVADQTWVPKVIHR